MSFMPRTLNCTSGCYFLTPGSFGPSRIYLPQVELRAHTTVHSTAFRTTLFQVYQNTRSEPIEEIRYNFPLDDGVSVVAFECLLPGRVIKGFVKEKDDAKITYERAKSQGKTAGLLEQLPDAADVFTTTIGNIPADSTVTINITYIGELKHDAEVDGMRLTVPTSIAPRYGSHSGEILKPSTTGKGVEIYVDIHLNSNSRIKQILSPSHQISVGLGTLTDTPDAEPEFHKGSASLALGTAELAHDFVLQIVAKDTGIPKAILETHPTIPHQRALMATLVPKFSLKPIKPEIIFVADRSGSMGSNIATLKAAIQVFLKSLPVSVKFNICSFGSTHQLLWPQSQPYSQESLRHAQQYVDTFAADLGGTETLNAISACIESRFESIETEIILLTDGDIWGQDHMFDYINQEVRKSSGHLRIFPIGIGGGVSSSLIEGVARAGNGFAQHVGNGERLDGKIVRMLKGALTPHIADYTLEVNYKKDSPNEQDDDYDIVEKVGDSMEADLSLEDQSHARNVDQKAPISLFDPNSEEKMDISEMKDSKHRFDHLPRLKAPKLLQAPHRMPPLFPFSRTSVYVLMSPDTSHLNPTSVTLRGTSDQGPLELHIPIESSETPTTTIHCLAAKKATQELEEGRGWLHDAKDREQGKKLVKDVHSARFDEIVQREAVRLGVQFQVAGKWTSYVAVEQDESTVEELAQNKEHNSGDRAGFQMHLKLLEEQNKHRLLMARQPQNGSSQNTSSGNPIYAATSSHYGRPPAQPRSLFTGTFGSATSQPRSGGLFGSMVSQQQLPAQFGAPPPASQSGGVFGSSTTQQHFGGSNVQSLFGSASANIQGHMSYTPTSTHVSHNTGAEEEDLIDYSDEDGMDMGMCLVDDGPDEPAAHTVALFASNNVPEPRDKNHTQTLRNPNAAKGSPVDLAAAIIDAQSFEGSWTMETACSAAIGVKKEDFEKMLKGAGLGGENAEGVLATVVVLLFLENRLAEEKESLELVIEKGWAWMDGEVGEDGIQTVKEVAEKLLQGLL